MGRLQLGRALPCHLGRVSCLLTSRVHKNLPEADFEAALLGAGLHRGLARLLADGDAGAAGGALFDDGRDLSRLIGRPTTSLAESVREALRAG